MYMSISSDTLKSPLASVAPQAILMHPYLDKERRDHGDLTQFEEWLFILEYNNLLSTFQSYAWIILTRDIWHGKGSISSKVARFLRACLNEETSKGFAK